MVKWVDGLDWYCGTTLLKYSPYILSSDNGKYVPPSDRQRYYMIYLRRPLSSSWLMKLLVNRMRPDDASLEISNAALTWGGRPAYALGDHGLVA